MSPDWTSTESVVVVGAGRAQTVAEILAGQGYQVERRTRIDELAPEWPEPGLVVFADLGLVEASQTLKRIGPRGRRPTALVVCGSIRPGEVRTALAAGIAGVVLVETVAETLVPTVTAVLSGQVAVPRGQARQVEAASLSTREKQILGLVVMGCPNSEIAERLVVAESTVKSHLSSAFGKLGVRSRNEAVDLVLDADRGLGKGILGLGGEPIETEIAAPSTAADPAEG